MLRNFPLRNVLVLLAVLTVPGPVLALQDDNPQQDSEALDETIPEVPFFEAGEPDAENGDRPMEWLRRPGFEPVVCPFRGRIDYEPGEVRCGLITVPENREVTSSRSIELFFVHLPARGEDHEGNEVETRDDPVIYLTGGPGVQVADYVERLKDHRLLDRRDLYILEQRGIGNSGDFCPFFADRNRADWIHADFDEASMALLRAARRCAEKARSEGVDIRGYHTFENARDVKALRLALGIADWNLWGISYGSVLGQAYMQVDPEGIRAAVIDAIVPLDLHQLMRMPHWHRANLDKLFAACAAQSDCAEAYPELEQRHLAAIAMLLERPVGVDVPESEIWPDGRAWFHAELVAGLPFGMLYEQDSHPAIPAIMDGLSRAVENRDEDFFRALALAASEQSGGMGLSWGMSMAVRCQDGYVDRWAENAPADFAAYPTLARAFGSQAMIQAAPEACRKAGLAPRDPKSFRMAEIDLPVVVANGALDPITPVPLAEYVMQSFPEGRLAVFPNTGHGPTRSVECAGEFLNGFFDDPAATLDEECINEGADEAEYIAPYFATAAAVKGLVMHGDHPERLKIHAAWGGISAALTLTGFVLLGGGWISRRLNGSRAAPAAGRLTMFLATLTALGWAGGLGAAAGVTAEIAEPMVIFGLVGWAGLVAWLAPLAALLALLGLVQSLRGAGTPRATRIGLVVTAVAVLSLSVFGLVWDLWPL